MATAAPAHTPKRLEGLATETLAHLVIKHSVPPSIHRLALPHDAEYWIALDNSPSLDKILMATTTEFSECLPKKEQLLEHLLSLRAWWEDNEWLGWNSEVWRRVRECLAAELEYLDHYCSFPLFRLLLQLLFSSRVGKARDALDDFEEPTIQVELVSKFCPVFTEVLKKMKPFGIEELSTQFILFGNHGPLQVILENSPRLRRVHFRKNIMEETLSSVGRSCPLLDTFVMEVVFGILLVPVDCLYKTFFGGLDRQAVDILARTGSLTEQQACMSFPRLRFLDLGKESDCPLDVAEGSFSEFIYYLLYFYSQLEDLSCHNMRPFVPKPPSRLPPHLRSLTYSLRHLDLEGLMIWTQDLGAQELSNHFLSSFPRQRHLTLTHDQDTHMQVIDFAKTWIPRVRCHSLTIYLYFTMPQDGCGQSPLSLYLPLLSVVGNGLSALQLDLHTEVRVSEVCAVLSLCPNLEVLGLVLYGGISSVGGPDPAVQKLPQLTSLSVEGPGPFALFQHDVVNSLVEQVILASPALRHLELVMQHRPLMWLTEMAHRKELAGLEVLLLRLNPHGPSCVSVEFYVQLLEHLPSLEVLMLGSVSGRLFLDLKLIYRKSELRLVTKERPYISNKLWH